MDGFSTTLTQGVAGALASHEAARQQLAREARQRRFAERRGGTDADPDASDPPVEEMDKTPELTDQLPHQPPPRVAQDALPNNEASHLDVTA